MERGEISRRKKAREKTPIDWHWVIHLLALHYHWERQTILDLRLSEVEKYMGFIGDSLDDKKEWQIARHNAMLKGQGFRHTKVKEPEKIYSKFQLDDIKIKSKQIQERLKKRSKVKRGSRK